MYQSPSTLPKDHCAALATLLNARLADGLDLHGQIKVAHWNIKGPQFRRCTRCSRPSPSASRRSPTPSPSAP